MKDIFSFYKNIFEEELARSKRLHLYSQRIVKKLFLSGTEELTNAEHPLMPISEKKAKSFELEISLRGEKVNLKYYSLARISTQTAFNNTVTRAYPLFSFDAEIIFREGLYYIKLDLDSRSFLKSNFSAQSQSRLDFNQLLKKHETLDFHFVSDLANKLEAIEDCNSDDLIMFPKLASSQSISGKLKKKEEDIDSYMSCAVLCLVEKEDYSFSTLDELKKMVSIPDYSMPLKVLFGHEPNAEFTQPGIICEELNYAQKEAINNANGSVVSVVSGPPGTGKSYSIANLAVEYVSKGKSVLISSKNNEALEVIEDKIKAQLNIKNITVNPSKDKMLDGLKDYLKTILGRSFKRSDLSEEKIKKRIKDHHKKKEELIDFEKAVENSFELEKSVLDKLSTHKLSRQTSNQFKERVLIKRGIKTIPLWESLYNYYNLIEKKRKHAIGVIQDGHKHTLDNQVKIYRAELRHYYDFLRARDRERKKDLYEYLNHPQIISTFPIWLVKASEISKVIPLEKEVFDLVIIDEASQCDIPSMIPILQRAKKCVVVGDQNQLSHISFLGKEKENMFRAQVRSEFQRFCKHRDYSFLALVSDTVSVDQHSFLSEHFRSEYSIIDFSSKAFYQDNLEILTKRPKEKNNIVDFRYVEGENKSGVNFAELDEIVNNILEIITREKDRPVSMKTSIGILSPFRKQVDKTFEAVRKNINLSDIKAHQIRVGTAFSFQGNERDLMFLSFVADGESHSGTYNYINRKDVFNVSVTRARFRQIVFHSFSPKGLRFDSTLGQFFSYYEQLANPQHVNEVDNRFCEEIEHYFRKFGYQTWQQYEISGVIIDVLAEKDGQYIAIDLVGFPGSVGEFYPLERYKMLERGNIKLFPLPYAYWLYDKSLCLKSIEQLCF